MKMSLNVKYQHESVHVDVEQVIRELKGIAADGKYATRVLQGFLSIVNGI